MASDKSLTNTSFDILRGSSKFLNTILDNITSCILLLNDKMELQAYNDALKTIFSNKKDEHLLYQRCGEAIGCAYQVEEAKECGKTSHCKYCDLRVSALKSYAENKPVYNKHFSSHFFNTENQKVLKHLQFSTRLFLHDDEKYIIMIIEDITKFISQQEKISALTSEKHTYN